MIKIGDTFKADGNEWKVTEIDDMEGITLEYDCFSINVCTCDKQVYAYEQLKNGEWQQALWSFTFAEIKMVAEIIDRVTS